jgi:hypothetical protein
LPTKDIKNNTVKITNNTLAMVTTPEAIPPKPKIAVMIAITKNGVVLRNINVNLKVL